MQFSFFKLQRAAMAVTQRSDGNSKKTVEEGAEPSCREDADQCRPIHLRKSNGLLSGPSAIKKDVCGMVKRYRPRLNRNKDNKSLSRLDDAEITGYLNTKDEIQLKRILWEAMNGKCTKAKKQKRTETKKGVSAKKDAKTTKSEAERQSSKINYDALKLLDDELEQNSETVDMIKVDSNAHANVNSQHVNISYKMCGSDKGSHEDDQHDLSDCEDSETFGLDETCYGYGDETYYGDEHFSHEDFDF